MKYRFVINHQASEAYDEESIKKLIDLRLVQRDSLAWCEGMRSWKPASDIPELNALFAPNEAVAIDAMAPPPIPENAAGTAASSDSAPSPPDESPPPPQTAEKSRVDDDPVNAAHSDAGDLQDHARRFVYWFFRPWRGRPSRVRAYIDEDPKRTIPVAAALAVGLFFLFALALSPFVVEDNSMPQSGPSGPAGAQHAMPPGTNNMEQWRIMRDAQRHVDNTIDDAYRYRRDSFDQQSETYRRANYDWYGDD